MGEQKYFDKEFDSLAEKLLARYHVPSISIAVVDDRKTYSKAYGLARFPSTPATPDTLYWTGSTTKAMLAAALGVAIHNPDKIKIERKSNDPVSWSTPLQSVLGEDFTLHDKYVSDNATIEDSLSHRIGFSGHDLVYGAYLGDSPRELTKRLRYLGPLTKPFRTTMQYNNVMYAVAGDVLETITGTPCTKALRELLWKPLGMDRTFWHLQEVVDAPHVDTAKHLSRGYFWVPGSKSEDGFYVPDSYVDFAGVAPAGSVVSSVNEYAKWIQALLDAASDSKKDSSSPTNPITNRLFTELTASRITSTLTFPQNSHLSTLSWGLGWNVLPALSGSLHPMIAHSGGLPGYGTQLYILPNDSFGVVTLGNTTLSSHIAGYLLSAELMARKLDLKSPGREQELHDFNLLMKAQNVGLEHCIESHPDDDTSEDHQTMLKATAVPAGARIELNEFVHKKDQNLSELQELEGVYTNGAHGSYRISIVEPAADSANGREKVDTVELLYRFPRDKSLNETKDKVRSSCYSLKISMEGGKRSWNPGYLLHPRAPESTKDKAKDTQLTEATTKANDNITQKDDNITWFDQESLGGHGSQLEDDVVPGLPSGADGEDGDGTGRCRGGKYWESAIWTRLGAVFVKDEGTGKLKMGMTLGNSLYVVDGTREEGFERSKAWFEKEG